MPPPNAVAEPRARINRPRVAACLADALEAGSVLLTAPAGFGKSTALEEAVRRRGTETAWVSCTSAERAPGRLLLRVLEALRRTLPGVVDVFGERLAVGIEQVDVAAAGTELVAELERLLVDPLVIVIDEAEALDGYTGSLELVGELLRADVRPLRVAVASRVPLRLRTAKLRAAGRLSELGPADLAFDVGECADFLRSRYGSEPEPEEVEALISATEGWPLGVAVGTSAPLGAAERAGPGAPSLRSRAELYAFLSEEVLDRLDRRQRDAVIDSSLPRHLTPEVAEALRLPTGFLEEAERIGLFLRRVDARSFGYHPLFREFLLERLEEERPRTRREQLHAQVAPAVAAAGYPIDAIEHWLEAGYWPQVIAGLDEQGPALVRTSPDSVRAWIARLPEEVRAEPALRLLEGQLEWGAGDHERAAELLRGAIAGYAYQPDPPREWLARFTLSDALFSLGGWEEAIQLANGFDEPAGAAGGPLAPATAVMAGACLAAIGRPEDSDAIAERARAHPAAMGLAPLESMRRAYVDAPAGRLDTAVASMHRDHAVMQRDDPFGRLPYIEASIALVYTDQGRDEEALMWWRRVGEGASTGFAPFLQRTSRVYRALLHGQAGRLRDAERELALGAPLQATGWRVYHLDIARAAVAALRGEAAEARAGVESALARVAPAPLIFRYWVAADVVPILAQVGERGRAREVVGEALEMCDASLPGAGGASAARGCSSCARGWAMQRATRWR